MDPKHLMQLAIILEQGSISKASLVLHLTQPTLTHNMQLLEAKAGGQLFERSRFGVRSTALGEVLAREGRAIARRVRDANEACFRQRSGFDRTLRLGVGPLIGAALMPGLMSALSNHGFRYALSVQSDRPHLLVDQLVDGRHDFVIAPSWLDKPPPGVERFLLKKDEIGVFCSQSHPAVGLKKLTGEFDWIMLGTASPFEQNVREMLQEAGIKEPSQEVRVMGDTYTLLATLSQGRHLAALPKFPLKILGPTFGLTELKVNKKVWSRNIFVWCSSTLMEDEALMSFKDFIVSYASNVS
jgi:DNA-binding transcriptional LysR family regulator